MALTDKGNFIVGTTVSGTTITDGVEYIPMSMKIDYEATRTTDSAMADDGGYHINYLIHSRTKLDITMPPYKYGSSAAASGVRDNSFDMKNLINTVQGQKYYITYFDTRTNAEKTINVFTDSTSSSCYSGVIYNGTWQGLSFTATEIKGA